MKVTAVRGPSFAEKDFIHDATDFTSRSMPLARVTLRKIMSLLMPETVGGERRDGRGGPHVRSQNVPERHDTGAARCRQSARRDDGIGASVSIRGAFTTHRARCVVSMPVRRRHDKKACHKRPPSGRLNPTCWTRPRAARVPTLECQRYALVTLMAGGNDRSHSVRFPDRP